MTEPYNFPAFLNEKLKEKGLTLEQFSEITGIALGHLKNLSTGNFKDLPPMPYVYGYIKRIGQVLDFNVEEHWNYLKSQKVFKSSFIKDEEVENRYRCYLRLSAKKTKIVVLIFLLLGVSYFLLRFAQILGLPQIDLIYPNQSVIKVQIEQLEMKGKIRNGDKLTINGEAIPIEKDGSWQKKVILKPGLNVFELSANKFLGRETKIIQQIIYELPAEETSSVP